MICAQKVTRVLQKERQRWMKEFSSDYVRGIRCGLGSAIEAIEAEHERVKGAEDNSPFVWKTSVVRKMLGIALNYFKNGNRRPGIAIIEKVLRMNKKDVQGSRT